MCKRKLVFLIERSRYIIDIVPTLRGEVSIGNGFVITTTRDKLPILIKKDDPFIGDQLRFFGSVKSDFSEIANFLCKRTDIVVEVGAYFGYNSITLGHKVKNYGKLYAFEPNLTVLSYLKKTIMLNELENTVVLKAVAISDRAGLCEIDDVTSFSKTTNKSDKSRTITVDCNLLDSEMAEETKPIDLLLIDIPGCEFQIINGAMQLIKRSPQIAIVAMFDQGLSSRNVNIQAEIETLAKEGFRFYWCDNIKKKICPVRARAEDIIEKDKAVLVITKRQL